MSALTAGQKPWAPDWRPIAELDRSLDDTYLVRVVPVPGSGAIGNGWIDKAWFDGERFLDNGGTKVERPGVWMITEFAAWPRIEDVQGSIATKQESCPEGAPRTETAIVPARRECRCDNPMVKCDHTGIRCTMCGELARIDAALSGVTNSAPANRASHNSGERDPVVMPDCPGADTKSDGGVESRRHAATPIGLGEARKAKPMSCSIQEGSHSGQAGVAPGPSDAQLTKTPSADHDAGNLRGALKGLIDYVERNECTHEETHRGGAIWTICDCCGRKWADDRGGFVPYIEPVELTNARAAIDHLERKSSAPDDAGNLRSLAEPTPRDSSESTTGGAR